MPQPLYKVGPVRVVERSDGRFRVLTTIQGKQRERTKRALGAARELADEWAAELAVPGATTKPSATYGDLLTEFLHEDRHLHWGRKHRDRLRGFARNHLVEIAGVRCRDISDVHFNRVLRQMSEEGYAHDTVKGVLDLIKTSVKYGRQKGYWPAWLDPAYGVRQPPAPVDVAPPGQVQPLDPSELPTADQTHALLHRLGLLHPTWRLLGSLAVTSGLRWGELIGLTPAQWSPADGVLVIDRQLSEHDHGFEFKLPKHRKVRQVLVRPDLHEQLTERSLTPAGTFDGHDLLFAGVKGGVLRRSNFNRRVARPCMDDAGWSGDLVWHSLRHRFCVDMLTAGVPIEDVSALAGHASTDFTYKKYVSADANHIDRARTSLGW